MSTNPLDSPSAERFTGEAARFLNLVKQTAAQQVSAAHQQRSETIADANQAASAAIAAAHKTAMDVICQNFQGLYVLTENGVCLVGTQGKCSVVNQLGGAQNIVVDTANQRLFWARVATRKPRLGVQNGKGNLREGEIAFYSGKQFQGTESILNKDTVRTFHFNGIGSLRVGPNTTVGMIKGPEFGFYTAISEDTPDVDMVYALYFLRQTQSADIVVGSGEFQLMTSNLDGGNATVVATLAADDSASGQGAGWVTLSREYSELFWKTPDGRVAFAPVTGGAGYVVVQMIRPTYPRQAQRWGIEWDEANANVFWSSPDAYGWFYVSPPEARSCVITDPIQKLPPFSESPPPKIERDGWPAIAMALDIPNYRMYCCNGQQIWRSPLLRSWLMDFNPVLNQPETLERLYGSTRYCHGLKLDQATQMLYWLDGSDLMRMNVHPGLEDFEVQSSVEKVFGLQGVDGAILDFVLVTSTGTAADLLTSAQTRNRAAQVNAASAIQAAHENAATMRDGAQKKLTDAHETAATTISSAQGAAAAKRQAAQSSAQSKRDQAAAIVDGAKKTAADDVASANSQAQNYISEKQGEAAGITSGSQAKLDAARRQLQSS